MGSMETSGSKNKQHEVDGNDNAARYKMRESFHGHGAKTAKTISF
jgi:hypothetical protein